VSHVIDPSTTASWFALERHRDEVLRSTTLRELFEADPLRAQNFAASAAGWYLDFSKQRIDARCLSLLLDLARETAVESQRDAMLAGERINVTEDRSVLHTALRAPAVGLPWNSEVDGEAVLPVVRQMIERMAGFARQIRDGSWCGATGQSITAVINIGIGGSDLGPAMVTRALAAEVAPDLRVRYVSNVDPANFTEVTADLDPARTLVIVSSKTFTTQETMSNAALARQWIVSALGDDAVSRHFAAVSTNADAVAAFGIDPVTTFGFWDWVGGRYSVTSAIGLSTMIAIGPELFSELLAGCHAMDEHFRTAALEVNLPVLMGMLAVWNRTFLGVQTHAVLPYAHDLARFPAYLQQLAMESNGKRVRRDGSAVTYDTGAIVWGEPGTNGQHSFYQLIHQGTSIVACDVIAFAATITAHAQQHDILVAHALAQASVMAFGRTAAELTAQGVPPWLVPHKTMPGDRPSSFLLASRLDARALGALIALYEHCVFVQGAVWGINSFDQWGVELGKSVAGDILADMNEPGVVTDVDPSTAALVRQWRRLRDDG
jgi:glucose-6-phosphate isomerase